MEGVEGIGAGKEYLGRYRLEALHTSTLHTHPPHPTSCLRSSAPIFCFGVVPFLRAVLTLPPIFIQRRLESGGGF